MKLKLDNFLNATLRPLVSSQDMNKPSIWIFGYGSLMWNPGFEYQTQSKARLSGYSRRFYQANMTYRGTIERPGRVVTIVEDDQSSDTYGIAFKVQGWTEIMAALEHLHIREIQSGYVFRVVTLELVDNAEPVQALTCIALKENSLFMGPECDLQEDVQTRRMAFEIATARGKAGPNHEYLSKLADCMRKEFPTARDDHLFQLEAYMLYFMNIEANEWDANADLPELRLESVLAN